MNDSLSTEPSLDLGRLRQAIQEEYAAVARDPGRGYHFHTGRPLVSLLGYQDDWLEGLPEGSIASFAGTGTPFASATSGPVSGSSISAVVLAWIV